MRLPVEVLYHQLLQHLGWSASGITCPAQEVIPVGAKLLIDGETKSDAV